MFSECRLVTGGFFIYQLLPKDLAVLERKTAEAIIDVSTLEFISARTQQVAKARNNRHRHIVSVDRLIKFEMPSCTLVYLSSFPKTDLFGGFELHLLILRFTVW